MIARGDGVGEGQRERIAIIRRSQPTLPHVGLALELNSVAAILLRVAVFYSRQIIDQLWVVVDRSRRA